MELQPGMEVDRYRVEQLLGRGGMASVWKVTRTDLGVSYALKVLEAPGRSVRERLRGEARMQATLRHPNVVSVVDVPTLDAGSSRFYDRVIVPVSRLLQRPFAAPALGKNLVAVARRPLGSSRSDGPPPRSRP